MQQADGSRTTYTYDPSGRLTQVKDPLGNVVTVVYDSAGRVGTITRPDSTTEEFSAVPGAGLDQQRHVGQPGRGDAAGRGGGQRTPTPTATTTSVRPDWYGLGTTGAGDRRAGQRDHQRRQRQRPGHCDDRPAQPDRPVRLRLARQRHRARLPRRQHRPYTYNSFAEPLTHTDANSNVTSYTYDAHGNLTVIQDPLNNLTTMTYTGNGRVQRSRTPTIMPRPISTTARTA